MKTNIERIPGKLVEKFIPERLTRKRLPKRDMTKRRKRDKVLGKLNRSRFLFYSKIIKIIKWFAVVFLFEVNPTGFIPKTQGDKSIFGGSQRRSQRESGLQPDLPGVTETQTRLV